MARKFIYAGEQFKIAFASEKSGAYPAGEFFDKQSKPDQAKLMTLFTRLADHGAVHNPEKFGNLGGGLYEFKSFQLRMPFAYARERQLVLITHGFVKKKNRTPPDEISRAWRIYNEDQS